MIGRSGADASRVRAPPRSTPAAQGQRSRGSLRLSFGARPAAIRAASIAMVPLPQQGS